MIISELTIWIPTGVAAQILGISQKCFKDKFKGKIRCITTPGGSYRWSLQEVERLANSVTTEAKNG